MKLINTAVVGASSAAPSPLLTDLVAYWKLENVNDSHTNGLTLTNNNSVTFTAGKVSNAGTFASASSQYLSRASSAEIQFGDEDFTIACWVKAGASGSQVVASKDTAGNREWFLFWNVNQLTFNINAATSASATSLSTGTWYFAVCEHDATADTISIQVNNGTAVSAATAGVAPQTGTSALEIGRFSFNAGLNFDGQIDEFGMWRRKLTAGERTTLYNGGTGLSYPFS